ncbi:unnamed protein product, partial [Meganyctiphanes norvegica]
MSDSVWKAECQAKFSQGSSLRNIANGDMDVEVQPHNENIKEKMEVKEEQLNNQTAEINLKNEIEIYAEPKAFTGGNFPLKHELTYTGEKSYPCSQCDEAFSNNSTLIKHRITHTGEIPYQFNNTYTDFSQSSNLNSHMRKHTGKKRKPMQPV